MQDSEAGVPKGDVESMELANVWKFETDPDNVGVGEQWYAPETDDSGGGEVRSNLEMGWESQGFPGYTGYGWYRQRVKVPKELTKGKFLCLLFAGVDEEAEVYINGQKAFEHTYDSTGLTAEQIWDTPFAFDPRQWLKPGEENLVAVRVRNTSAAGGVWRPVYLVWSEVEMTAREMSKLIDAPKIEDRIKEKWRTKEIFIYGSEESIKGMMQTYNMGGVEEPTGEELAQMQKSDYIFRARGGELTKVSAEKSRLPYDPEGHSQRVHVAKAPDGSVYVYQLTFMCKSTDGGRTWISYDVTMPGSSFQILSDGTFIAMGSGGQDNPAQVGVFASRDEGRTWQKLSEVPNPAACPVRHAGALCRLPDDTLVLPVESRAEWARDPEYVHCSTDGGRTWTGPTGCNTGPCFLGANSYETMIAGMASGRLLAVIRYHGPVVSPWPLIDPDQHTQYKTVFLSDSDDGGTTWQNLRPLTNVHGQCHGYGVGLSDGTAVVAFDHRYPPGTPSGKAMVSRDEGRTWEDEVYYLYYGRVGSGFSQSVVLEGDVILTVGATSESTEARTGWDAGIGKADLVAIRWKPEKG